MKIDADLKKAGISLLATGITEGVKGVKNICIKYNANYIKRREVGFDVAPSLSGAFKETKKYYSDILVGRKPTEMKQCITFDK